MSYNTRAKRSAAIICALGISLAPAATGIAVAPAFAQTAPGNINHQATGSINIHKLVGAETEIPSDGNALTDEERAQLAESHAAPTAADGVNYTITKVQADLTTNAGFEAAKALTPATAVAATGEEAYTDTKPVDGAGNAIFSELPIGVYLVEEEVTGENSQLVPGKPFLVFVPMTADSGDNWNYDVHVYPKNTKAGTTKTVVDVDQHQGSNIVYTINSDIPDVPGDGIMVSYRVVDQLDPRLTPAGVEVTLSNGTAIAEGTDYTVTTEGNNVEVIFTEAGRQKLTDVPAGTQVVTKITATVGDVSEGGVIDEETGGFVIENDAITHFNNGNGDGEVSRESEEVKTYWGDLQVVKHAEDGEETVRLAGAKFKLTKCGAPEAFIIAGGQDEWTTDANGNLVIEGLHVSDYADDAAVTDQFTYCLVETEAPAGYALIEDPIEITFTREDLKATGESAATKTADTSAAVLVAEVENLRKTTPSLPSTGGMGVGLIIAAGLGIMGFGAFSARRNSKKA